MPENGWGTVLMKLVLKAVIISASILLTYVVLVFFQTIGGFGPVGEMTARATTGEIRTEQDYVEWVAASERLLKINVFIVWQTLMILGAFILSRWVGDVSIVAAVILALPSLIAMYPRSPSATVAAFPVYVLMAWAIGRWLLIGRDRKRNGAAPGP
jgi:hypothetical protein